MKLKHLLGTKKKNWKKRVGKKVRANMGKKRDIANKHIEQLIDRLVAYEEGYVGRGCCPYKFALFGADNIKKPNQCDDCESCKEYFFLEVNNNLRKRFIVE